MRTVVSSKKPPRDVNSSAHGCASCTSALSLLIPRDVKALAQCCQTETSCRSRLLIFCSMRSGSSPSNSAQVGRCTKSTAGWFDCREGKPTFAVSWHLWGGVLVHRRGGSRWEREGTPPRHFFCAKLRGMLGSDHRFAAVPASRLATVRSSGPVGAIVLFSQKKLDSPVSPD